MVKKLKCIVSLQSPFNVVTYSIIGDDQAPTLFNINPSTGFISMSSGINNDGTSFYQVCIIILFLNPRFRDQLILSHYITMYMYSVISF